jgi:hypothetical protein
MANNNIEKIRQEIFDENNGIQFSKLKDKLFKNYLKNDRIIVLEILTEYVKKGGILHWRNFLLSDIVDIVNQNEKQYADFFEWTISVEKLTYWGIDGLLKTKGKDSYCQIVELINMESLPIEIRAKAVKSISEFSKQTFDKDLPSDPGYWKVENIEITKIKEWQKNGYSDGFGYSIPQTHSSLQNPKSELEKLAFKLDKKLEKLRKKEQDLSNPSNWLIVANDSDILEIEKKWTLPNIYLSFLKNYSPLKVNIDSKKFTNGLTLYGANDLIEGQNGYSYNPITEKKITDFPLNFVVIGNDGGDPFCIDVESINYGDAPIYTSMHGEGDWEFELYSNSFIDFLNQIT